MTTLAREFLSLTQQEKKEQLAVANELLGWAAYHDLADLDPMFAAKVGEPTDVTKSGKRKLSEKQRLQGTVIFQSATTFILMHELRHLEQRHEESTVEIERETDSFAASWLCQAASTGGLCEVERILTLFGIASALCWLTVPEIHFRPVSSTTHPFAYNRLYQTLDEVINSSDAEHHFVWFLVKQLLLTHMKAVGFEFWPDDDSWKSEDSKAVVNYLIDRISCHEKQLSAVD